MKIGIVIGRFQGFHEGHKQLLERSFELCDKLVVLLGSCNKAPSIKNPFSVQQRIEEIERFCPCVVHAFEQLNDYVYDDEKWIAEVNTIINYYKLKGDVVLFGHEKEGNDYLSWFPGISYENIEGIEGINATLVRQQLFNNRDKRVAHLQEDWDYFEQEKKMFSNYPYPETLNFCCADAVVECFGHVLLIKRKNAPGKGLWALPGGFKNNNETYLDCAIRELKEETGIQLVEDVLKHSVVQSKMFDNPGRNFGIPRNTLAVHMQVDSYCGFSFPEIKPQDDASDVRWAPLKQIGKEFKLHDDHQDIILALTTQSKF